MTSPADTIREALTATKKEFPTARVGKALAALTELEADRDRYREALEQAVRTIDHWDATIGQPPDPPSAEEMLFAVRDLARAALDRHTKAEV
jgi:hypothetical protein